MRYAPRTTLWIVLAALVACPGCPTDPPQDDDDSTAEVTVAFDAELTLSEHIPTVGKVHFSVDHTGVEQAYVEFGPDTDYGTRAPATGDDDAGFDATLLGMKPTTDYHYRSAVVIGGETHTSDDAVLTTGLADPDMPPVAVECLDPDRATGGFFVFSLVGNPAWSVIVDADGDPVWWYASVNETYLVSRALLAHDRESMLYLGTYSGNPEDANTQRFVVRVSIDGSEVVSTQVVGAHHDMTELPDGTVAVIRGERDDCDVGDKVGAQIIELDADGNESLIWSVWDHFECVAEEAEVGGWTHGNALDYAPDEDAYYLGMRNFHTIVKVDRSTGELLWAMGGPKSDFVDGEGSADLFVHQHQFDVLDGSILVFDNGSEDAMVSRAVEYSFDESAMEVDPIWSHSTDPPLFVYSLGDANRLPSGNTLITWTTAGQLDEVTPEGELVWQAKTPLGAGIGYTTWLESLY